MNIKPYNVLSETIDLVTDNSDKSLTREAIKISES